MGTGSKEERTIMVMAELENGDGYIYATANAQRAIEQLEEWSLKFGSGRVRANEGFEELARPLMNASASSPN